jgi:uncharacterized membrane protein YfcA
VILPIPAFIAVTLIVLCVMLAGFAGPPARRPRPRLAWALFAVGVAGLGLAAWLVYTVDSELDSLAAAGAACVLALSARFLREPRGDDPPRGGTEPPDDPEPPQPEPPREPWDWGEFDRAREQWPGSGEREGAEL